MEFLFEEKEEITDPKRLKLINEVRTYINFLLRHVAIMTFKFNVFFQTRLTEFSAAMQLAEDWHFVELENKRAKSAKKKKKKKKGEVAAPVPSLPLATVDSYDAMAITAEELVLRIQNFKAINEASVYLTEHNVTSVSALTELLDLFGRMRGLLLIAGNLLTLLNKNFSQESEKAEDVIYYFNHWTGFCSRSFNCHIHRYPTTQLPTNLTPQEIHFIVWPLAVRSAIYCASQLIKDVCVLVDIDLTGYKVMDFNAFLKPEELLTMKNILFYFEVKQKHMFSPFAKAPDTGNQERLPKVDPALEPHTEPITMDTILLNFPHVIPEDVVKKKKGKKEKGKAKPKPKKKKK